MGFEPYLMDCQAVIVMKINRFVQMLLTCLITKEAGCKAGIWLILSAIN